MTIIADSGSTKTRWELVNKSSRKTVYTTGINPFYKNSAEIIADLQKELIPQVQDMPDKIFFYGAGISQEDKKQTVEKALRHFYPNSYTEVDHDLLAAARATCHNYPGIACILGTGSNSCLYDGKQIIDNVPSLGFLLGDEGSGGYIGRKLLQAYFYRELPPELKKKMESGYDMKKEHVLNSIYDSAMNNKVVAAFAKFASDNNTHPFISQLLEASFTDFLQRHVSKYADCKKLPVHFIGSIALVNKDILLQALKNTWLNPGTILKSPMEGLVQFHCG